MRLSHPTQTLITSAAREAGPAGSRPDHRDHQDQDRLVQAAQLVRPVRLRRHHRRAEPRLEPRRHPAKHLPAGPAAGPGPAAAGGGVAPPPFPKETVPVPPMKATYCFPSSIYVIGGPIPPRKPVWTSKSFSPLSAL